MNSSLERAQETCARSSQSGMLGLMKKGQHYYHGSHSRYRLHYHLVWIPKYRRRVLRGEIAKDLQRLFYDCAQMNNWWITSLRLMPDHASAHDSDDPLIYEKWGRLVQEARAVVAGARQRARDLGPLARRR